MKITNIFRDKSENNEKARRSREINKRSYFEKIVKTGSFPNYLLIEPTNFCNLTCPMCPRNLMTRKVGYMDISLFKKIINEIGGKVDFIYLHFFGESLFHPKIEEIINYAGKKGTTLSLSTNATILNEKNRKKIFNSNLDHLIISLDSLQKETYEKIRTGGDFQKTQENLMAFLDEYQEQKPDLNITIQAICLDENKPELESFVRCFQNIDGVHVTLKNYHSFANQMAPGPKGTPMNSHLCIEPWRGMVITWDGRVVPCCNDYDCKCVLGNANDLTIQEIWNSPEYQHFRSLHTSNQKDTIPLCKYCDPPYESLNICDLFSRFNPSFFETNCYFNRGIYSGEISNKKKFFWTEKIFEILVQDRGKGVTFFFKNSSPFSDGINADIYLFDKKVKPVKIIKRTKVFLETPPDKKGRLLRYRFVLDKTWCPKDFNENSEDTRELGIIIEDIVN